MENVESLKKYLIENYQKVRRQTEAICGRLSIEDHIIQSVIDVSPPKWHLAHTTWFFETFILKLHAKEYHSFHPLFHYIFNSYYHGIGDPYPRERRGLLARPTVKTVSSYRASVDKQIPDLINQATEKQVLLLQPLIILGLHHEQQHQELLLMDIKHNFSIDPHFPAYFTGQSETYSVQSSSNIKETEFSNVEGGIVSLGHSNADFCFDNELPRHQTFLKPYRIANRLVTNEEYCEFVDDGAYRQPQWWLSDGWDCLRNNHWTAPLYWHKVDDKWHVFTLSGMKPLNLSEPVAHISFFEADAYARWRGKRLPLETEWEHFVTHRGIMPTGGNFIENEIYHPLATTQEMSPQQFFGDLWEWTASPYGPYPGFKPLSGALGEYNGKFMNNQMVLRGGCCATPISHIRASYRNFFQPDKRWQFSGIRLAADL